MVVTCGFGVRLMYEKTTAIPVIQVTMNGFFFLKIIVFEQSYMIWPSPAALVK